MYIGLTNSDRIERDLKSNLLFSRDNGRCDNCVLKSVNCIECISKHCKNHSTDKGNCIIDNRLQVFTDWNSLFKVTIDDKTFTLHLDKFIKFLIDYGDHKTKEDELND